MRFLVDTQLPKRLAHRLREAGHEAEHVLDLNLAQSADNDLWLHATTQQAVIVTKDEDFAEWITTGRPGPSVVWLRIGNCSNTELLNWLIPQWPQVVQALASGDRLVEVT
jgi:predicted nuclease of predicted toxin-antitoxin system